MPKPGRKTTASPERRVVFDTLMAALNVAGDIGTGVGRMAWLTAEGALNAAARLSRAAGNLVDPKLVARPVPPPNPSELPEAALAAIGQRKLRQKAHRPVGRAAPRRKPLARKRARSRMEG